MYRISELAEKVGLSRSTLLYYEKLGLLQGGVLGILPPNIAKTAAGRASCGFWRPITYRLSAGSHQSIPLNPQVLAIHLSVRMCIYPGG